MLKAYKYNNGVREAFDGKSPDKVIVCGGGIKNTFLVRSIEKHIKTTIISTSEYGFNPQAIEAMAFGWMARQRVYKKTLKVNKNKGLLGTLTKSK